MYPNDDMHYSSETAIPMHDIIRRDPGLWSLFTREEEYSPELLDEFGRFPYYMSRDRNVFQPRVSEFLNENGCSMEFPGGHPFALCLTHDIDHVYTPIFKKGLSAWRSLKRGEIREAVGSISQVRSRKRPLCNFNDIMDLEEKYGGKSTFFFMVESPGDRAYSYDIEDVAEEIGEIVERGWEVGLHGGFTTHLDEQELRVKKERLERITSSPVQGYRNHYLCFKVPDTWEMLARAGFMYDSTLSYGDCAGFRNGMCHPFIPFNLNSGRSIGVIEIPLILMDGVLDSTHMRLDRATSWRLIRMLIDSVARVHGVFTVVWHNTLMRGEDLEMYRKILDYCKEKDALITSCSEIATIGPPEIR